MKKSLIVAAVAIAGAASAHAADMAARTYSKAPAYVAPIYNWTGFYVGVEGGGGWTDTVHASTNGGDSGKASINGGLVGGTYGYNYQAGSIVLGFEGDMSWSGIKRDFNDTNGSGFCSGPALCSTDLQWLGTDRFRLGYAWDRVLVFGTVGVAYGSVRGTLKDGSSFTVGENTRSGLTYGGGIEWALIDSWSVKAEYLHIDNLGDKVTYGTPGTAPVEKVSISGVDVVRAGLNYRFDWGKAPVVAKY